MPGAGPREARVVLLAEAPGADEEDAGAPLVGRSGSFLFDGDPHIAPHIWPGLKRLGLGRDVVRCENVLEIRPLENDLTTVSVASMAWWRENYRERLAKLPAMTLLVPMGNTALNAVLNTPLRQKRKRDGGREWVWEHTISAWRGSVNAIEVGGRRVTMLPTFHPAFFLHGGGMDFQAWRSDWAKVGEMAREGVRVEPQLVHRIKPTREDLEALVAQVEAMWRRDGKDALLVFDIETIGPIIDCIGFCVDGETTLTIPLLAQAWPEGSTDVRVAWKIVRALLAHEIPKGTHFGYYDLYRLERQKGLRVRRWWWDSFDMHHLLDPADEHSLAYCASRDLTFGYWKHESTYDKRKGKGLKRDQRDLGRRWRYNGKDVGVTWHLIRRYQARLAQGWPPTWEMMEGV